MAATASRMRGTRARERPSCAWELYPAAGKARERRPREAVSAMVCDGFLASALMLNFNHVGVIFDTSLSSTRRTQSCT